MQGALGKFRDISSRRIVRALALARGKESGLCERSNERGVTMKNVIISRLKRREVLGAAEERKRNVEGEREAPARRKIRVIAGWRRRKEGARERPIRSIHYSESF